MAYASSADNEEQGPDRTYAVAVPENDKGAEGPSDVFLDVPNLHLDELGLEVEDLRARVSLQAEVLDLLRLNVGADVQLGRVQLDLTGVDVEAQLKVRLHNVATILNRVLETVDRNPQILEQLTRGMGSAIEEIGGGTGKAVGVLGEGAGSAVRDVGQGAGGAVRDVGRGAGGAVRDVGRGAGSAVEEVGEGAGSAVEDVGEGAGSAVDAVGTGAGAAVEDIPEAVDGATEEVASGARSAVQGAGDNAADLTGQAAGMSHDLPDDARGLVDGAGDEVPGHGGDASAHNGRGDKPVAEAEGGAGPGRGAGSPEEPADGGTSDRRRSGRNHVRAPEVQASGRRPHRGRAPVTPRRRPAHRRER